VARRLDGNQIRIRVHDERGAMVKMPGLPDWQWVSKDGAPLGLIRMDDEFVSRPGWRELDVSERHWGFVVVRSSQRSCSEESL
jgi:hypothetical protein